MYPIRYHLRLGNKESPKGDTSILYYFQNEKPKKSARPVTLAFSPAHLTPLHASSCPFLGFCLVPRPARLLFFSLSLSSRSQSRQVQLGGSFLFFFVKSTPVLPSSACVVHRSGNCYSCCSFTSVFYFFFSLSPLFYPVHTLSHLLVSSIFLLFPLYILYLLRIVSVTSKQFIQHQRSRSQIPLPAHRIILLRTSSGSTISTSTTSSPVRLSDA